MQFVARSVVKVVLFTFAFFLLPLFAGPLPANAAGIPGDFGLVKRDLPGISDCQSDTIDNSFCIQFATNEGQLSRPANVRLRDGGAASLIGPWLLWTFGDTFGPLNPVDGQVRSYTAALSPPSPTSYKNLVHETDANGAPYQFIPYTDAEKNFNFCAQTEVSLRPSWCATVQPYPPKMQCDLSKGTCTEDRKKRCSLNSQCAATCVPVFNVCAGEPTRRCTRNSDCAPKCETDVGLCLEDQTLTCKANTDCRQRMVLWPNRPIETKATNCENRSSANCTGDAVVFYNKYRTSCTAGCYFWQETGTSKITLRANQINTRATRDPSPLFRAGVTGERSYSPAMQENGMVYLQADNGYFAKVDVANITNRGSYKFWSSTQNKWVDTASQATQDTNYSGGETISWNPYLKRYISLDFAGADGYLLKLRDIYMQAAKTPRGPWSPRVKIATTIGAPGENNYYAEEHPEISTKGGRVLRMTWVKSNSDATQDIRAAALTMKSIEDQASCVAVSLPSQVSRGQRFAIGVTMKNTGTRTWGNISYGLAEAQYSSNDWGITTTPLSTTTVAPGANASFILYATAPNDCGYTCNGHPLHLTMRHVLGEISFGQVCERWLKIN